MIIQVEGMDKAGKQTVSEWLAKMLALDGHQVSLMNFPDYSTPSGRLLTDILSGRKCFTPEDDPYLVQAVFTINRYEAQYRIERALQDGKVVVMDRYIGSCLAYGISDGVDPDWIVQINHSLIQPDVTVVLEISDEEYLNRCKNYEKLDFYESRLEQIRHVRTIYHKVAEFFNGQIFDGSGEPQAVAQRVYGYVKERMGK